MNSQISKMTTNELILSIELDIKTVSEANKTGEHWTKKHKRHNEQQWQIKIAFLKLKEEITIPCKIVLSRLSPRLLDDDNLTSAFKHIRDQIADCIFDSQTDGEIVTKRRGQNDGDKRLSWEYAQHKRKKQGIRIEIYKSDKPKMLFL